MAGKKIIIEMKGMLTDEGQVRFEDFIAQLDAFLRALRETDRIISKKEKPTVFYRITGLSQDSPSKVIVTAFPIEGEEDYSDALVDNFGVALQNINQHGEALPEFDYDALEAYKDIGKKINKGISYLAVSVNGFSSYIVEDFTSRVQLIQGPDEIAQGSLSGRIEAINFHAAPYRFTIYPIVGPARVRCNFPFKLKNNAISAIDKYVTVFGTIKYRHKALYPYEIDIDHIQPPPTEEPPKLADLKGIAPDLTGGLSSEEYIRKMRDLDG